MKLNTLSPCNKSLRGASYAKALLKKAQFSYSADHTALVCTCGCGLSWHPTSISDDYSLSDVINRLHNDRSRSQLARLKQCTIAIGYANWIKEKHLLYKAEHEAINLDIESKEIDSGFEEANADRLSKALS